jgi:hypothetical protein
MRGGGGRGKIGLRGKEGGRERERERERERGGGGFLLSFSPP